MKIEQRSPGSLKPHPRNSRTHPRAQIDMLARSIKAWGFIQPVVIDETGTILIGHGRTQAAIDAGLDTIPVVVRSDFTDAEKRALVIADNRLHETGAGWNKGLLDAELRHLVGTGFDITLTGFDITEATPAAAAVEEDDLPDDPATASAATSVPGDVWTMGPHRLACGSSTDPEAVAAALGGASPALMVTDPPYGVEYDATWRAREAPRPRAVGRVLNDDRADWREAWALFPGAVAYVWHGSLRASEVQRSLEAAGFCVREQIVWAKNRAAIGPGNYHWQHEPCLFATRSKGDRWRGGRGRSSVWEIIHNRSGTGHSTQKPVEAMRRPMVCHTGVGEPIYEPFMGSGTSLIAAETCGRVSLGVELNPDYVDLAVRRWQNFTGQEAVHAATGETFEATRLHRAGSPTED